MDRIRLLSLVVIVGLSLALATVVFRENPSIPFIAVTSGSMVHEGDGKLEVWLSNRGFTRHEIDSLPFMDGIGAGDMIVSWYPADIGVGDVATFERGVAHGSFYEAANPLTHRVVGVVEIVEGQAIAASGTLDCMTLADAQMYADYIEECRGYEESCLYPSIPATDTYRLYWTRGDANDNTDQCARAGGIAIPVNEAQLLAKAHLRVPWLGYPKLYLQEVAKSP